MRPRILIYSQKNAEKVELNSKPSLKEICYSKGKKAAREFYNKKHNLA